MMNVKVLYRVPGRRAWYEAEGAKVKVSSRCRTVEEAENWLRPKGVPPDALRQGEFYFIPAPAEQVGDPKKLPWTARTGWQSSREEWWTTWRALDARGRHRPKECRVLLTRGETAFIGRGGRVRTHRWEGRPRVYVRGAVEHPEHGVLQLPPHQAGGWYEVIPNRAHGPWRPAHAGMGID